MNSKERILAAWNGQPMDHIPLTTWCFGVQPPPSLRWIRNGQDIRHWYSLRLEHIHTLPQPWGLEDDFQRVRTWQSLGVDDVLDISIPWSIDPEVSWQDSRLAGTAEQFDPTLIRTYQTPSGNLSHAVRQTQEERIEGWVIQPETVPLFEDYNLPRAVKPAVNSPADVPIIRHLYQEPDKQVRAWLTARMEAIGEFVQKVPVPVQAWSAFGMDAVVWLMGGIGAIWMAVDQPRAFRELVEIVAETDQGRTELAASTTGVDMIVQRGWYSSTDLWSPKLFNAYVFPYLTKLSAIAHRHGKKFGYVMTTGVEKLGPRLADAGVDVLYFVDPLQDGIHLERARELLGDRMTLVGGINSLSLSSGDGGAIRNQVRQAIETLGSTRRFILHPVDALFPDTPWEGVEQMITAWKEG
jgi:uroporphyrinogen-III decarboxylase